MCVSDVMVVCVLRPTHKKVVNEIKHVKKEKKVGVWVGVRLGIRVCNKMYTRLEIASNFDTIFVDDSPNA
jgi:hypothetical protein